MHDTNGGVVEPHSCRTAALPAGSEKGTEITLMDVPGRASGVDHHRRARWFGHHRRGQYPGESYGSRAAPRRSDGTRDRSQPALSNKADIIRDSNGVGMALFTGRGGECRELPGIAECRYQLASEVRGPGDTNISLMSTGTSGIQIYRNRRIHDSPQMVDTNADLLLESSLASSKRTVSEAVSHRHLGSQTAQNCTLTVQDRDDPGRQRQHRPTSLPSRQSQLTNYKGLRRRAVILAASGTDTNIHPMVAERHYALKSCRGRGYSTPHCQQG